MVEGIEIWWKTNGFHGNHFLYGLIFSQNIKLEGVVIDSLGVAISTANIVAKNNVPWKIIENNIPKEKLFNPPLKPLNEIFLNNTISLCMAQILTQL